MYIVTGKTMQAGKASTTWPYKNLKIQALYGFVEDKTYAGDQHYNTGEIQLYWRF